jgi:hypothetical protein
MNITLKKENKKYKSKKIYKKYIKGKNKNNNNKLFFIRNKNIFNAFRSNFIYFDYNE